jgi:putative ABC transport system substrate-binding protein
MVFDFSMGGKWLDLLKEIAPHVSRVALFRDETNPPGIGDFGVIQAIATSAGFPRLLKVVLVVRRKR